jgi:hypothetical protein
MKFWCGSGSPDPYLRLMDPDPNPFFIDFKGMRKKKDPDPYLRLIDPDPEGLKACGSCGSGSPTLYDIII